MADLLRWEACGLHTSWRYSPSPTMHELTPGCWLQRACRCIDVSQIDHGLQVGIEYSAGFTAAAAGALQMGTSWAVCQQGRVMQ